MGKLPKLKTGMFGVMSNGDRFVVINDLVVYQGGGWDLVHTFSMPHAHTSVSKLVEVKSFNLLDYVLRNPTDCAKQIIYDRDEEIETVMTIAEIEQKLGITNLKIKKEGK